MTNKDEYTIAHDDTLGTSSSFKVPTDSNLEGEGYEAKFGTSDTEGRLLIQIVNGWDQNVDIKVNGDIGDVNLGNATQDGAEFTVESGTNDFIVIETGWPYVEVNVNPAADPTSGNLKVKFQGHSYA